MINKISKIFLIFVFLGLVYMFLKGYFYEREIIENKKETICKFIYCRSAPKNTTSFFKYRINNKWYKNSYGQCPEDSAKKINKFFILYYSSKDPNKIKVDFSKQIIDITNILNSGFTKEELK